MLKTSNLPKMSAQLDKPFSKYIFLKRKILRFEKIFLKIHSDKKKTSIFYRIFRCTPAAVAEFLSFPAFLILTYASPIFFFKQIVRPHFLLSGALVQLNSPFKGTVKPQRARELHSDWLALRIRMQVNTALDSVIEEERACQTSVRGIQFHKKRENTKNWLK